MKKLLSILLALVMILSLATTAFAQEVNSGKGGEATITISNASKGVTYKVVKLFDATINKDADSIAYTGTVPAELTDYFVADDNGYISATAAAKKEGGDDELSNDAVSAMKEWAKNQEPTASAESNGSVLEFTNLKYGYYIVLTSQGSAAITVVSTKPNADIYDKNSTPPGEGLSKTVNDENVNIGDTVTYTVSFNTANYGGAGETAKKIVSYTIADTLPGFLTDVSVTGITIGDTAYKVNDATPSFTNIAFEMPWDDSNGNSLYANGATVVITYTATVTNEADIDGDGNANKVTLTWKYVDGTQDYKETEEKIYTYALALKKVNEKDEALAGAKFAIKGLTVTGSDGYYTVTAYDTTATDNGTEMECDDEGNLVVVGLASDEDYYVTETAAPDGYNKLKDPVTVNPQVISETVTVKQTTVYYDENGVVTNEETEASKTTIDYNDALEAVAFKVENKAGTELPETGGMGTTLIYTLGAILAVGSLILLVVKKRMAAAE